MNLYKIFYLATVMMVFMSCHTSKNKMAVQENKPVLIEQSSTKDVETWIVAPDHIIRNWGIMVDARCLKIKKNEQDVWTTHCDGVEGFNHELGYTYTIKIKKVHIENPPADASSIRYELIQIISKIKTN